MLREDGSVFNCASQNFWHVLLKDWLQAIRLLLSQGRDISFPLILRAAFPLCSSSCSSCSVTIQMLIIQTELLWCFIMHVGERGMYCFLSCFVNLDHSKEHFVHLRWNYLETERKTDENLVLRGKINWRLDLTPSKLLFSRRNFSVWETKRWWCCRKS